jgi:hypothetical protein
VIPEVSVDAIAREPKVVVGSGWWSAGVRSQWTIGDDLTRSTAFFTLWYRQVMKSLNPSMIFVTDSRSPNKPDSRKFERVQWIELDKNYGHANDIRVGLSKAKFSGSNLCKIMGAAFALCCDADYFVHVQQGCVLRGDDFLKKSIGEQDFDFFCGQRAEGGRGLHGAVAAPMLQDSVLIMKKSGIENYISKIISAPETDGELSPEAKMERYMAPYGLLQVPYGRSRPIDFSRSHFYAIHLTRDELMAFLEAEHLEFSEWFPSS